MKRRKQSKKSTGTHMSPSDNGFGPCHAMPSAVTCMCRYSAVASGRQVYPQARLVCLSERRTAGRSRQPNPRPDESTAAQQPETDGHLRPQLHLTAHTLPWTLAYVQRNTSNFTFFHTLTNTKQHPQHPAPLHLSLLSPLIP